jgi:hypothetical protein
LRFGNGKNRGGIESATEKNDCFFHGNA